MIWDILNAAAWAQFPITLKESARLLGVRGFARDLYTPGENDMGVYDDLICVCDGPDVAHDFRASTDPGIDYIKNPINSHGCARLVPGLYWYALGDHKGHRALVQWSGVNVDRLDSKGAVTTREYDQQIGLNIHSGGAGDDVGRFSAGCQVIYDSEGAWGPTWQKFISLVESAMRRTGQPRIPYLLIEALTPLKI